jgi:hypothetical protein
VHSNYGGYTSNLTRIITNATFASQVSPKGHPARAQVPAVDDELPQRLVDFKRKVETGEVAPLTSFYLSNDKFTRSQAKIEGNFRRFDYDSRRQRITFRMPSPTHETFTQSLVSAIHVKLFLQGCQSQQVHDFIAKINTVGSAKVVLHHDDNAPGSHRQPDAQFPYKGVAFPCVVVEVAKSQDGRQLSKIAKDYIDCTMGPLKSSYALISTKAASPLFLSGSLDCYRKRVAMLVSRLSRLFSHRYVPNTSLKNAELTDLALPIGRWKSHQSDSCIGPVSSRLCT